MYAIIQKTYNKYQFSKCLQSTLPVFTTVKRLLIAIKTIITIYKKYNDDDEQVLSNVRSFQAKKVKFQLHRFPRHEQTELPLKFSRFSVTSVAFVTRF